MFFSKQLDTKDINAEIDQMLSSLPMEITLYEQFINDSLGTFDIVPVITVLAAIAFNFLKITVNGIKNKKARTTVAERYVKQIILSGLEVDVLKSAILMQPEIDKLMDKCAEDRIVGFDAFGVTATTLRSVLIRKEVKASEQKAITLFTQQFLLEVGSKVMAEQLNLNSK